MFIDIVQNLVSCGYQFIDISVKLRLVDLLVDFNDAVEALGA